MKSNAAVIKAGIISFGYEAAKYFKALTAEQQDAAYHALTFKLDHSGGADHQREFDINDFCGKPAGLAPPLIDVAAFEQIGLGGHCCSDPVGAEGTKMVMKVPQLGAAHHTIYLDLQCKPVTYE